MYLLWGGGGSCRMYRLVVGKRELVGVLAVGRREKGAGRLIVGRRELADWYRIERRELADWYRKKGAGWEEGSCQTGHELAHWLQEEGSWQTGCGKKELADWCRKKGAS